MYPKISVKQLAVSLVKDPNSTGNLVWVIKTAMGQNSISVSRKQETLTIAEHLIIGELPVFGKKNPKLEIHRALTIENKSC